MYSPMPAQARGREETTTNVIERFFSNFGLCFNLPEMEICCLHQYVTSFCNVSKFTQTHTHTHIYIYIYIYICIYKGKAVPLQAWSGPEGSRKLRFPDFMTRHRMVIRLSVLRTGRLYPQEMVLVLISFEAESTPGP